MSIHLAQHYSIEAGNDAVFERADRVMDSLMDREATDPGITDGNVSIDAGAGLVTVEVYTAEDRSESELMDRIRLALQDADIRVHEVKRELEFA